MAYGNQGNGGNTTPGGPSVGGARVIGGVGAGSLTPSAQGGQALGPARGTLSQNGINLAIGGVLETGNPLTTQTKVTQGYFTGDAGLLVSNLIHTGSLADSNEKYYFNITNTHPKSSSVATQFSVAYGDKRGSGSLIYDADGAATLKGQTQAIYQQFASLVLPESEVSGGFKISAEGSQGVHYTGTTPDEYIYVLVGARGRFKDELDYGSWTLKLSGSTTQGSGSDILYLTDDSKDTTATAKNSIYGRKFNIVSGSAGTVYTSSAYRTYGWYYPEAGFMIFSGAELSASIPGQGSGSWNRVHHNIPVYNMTSSFDVNNASKTGLGRGLVRSGSGFAPNLDDNGNPNNALKFVNCLRNVGSLEQRFRSAQIQNKKSYFLTVPPASANFSTNPTFVSGSTAKLRHKAMYGNPSVFISTVGLHRSDGRLVGIAKLSTPVIKNFGTQVTIKVNLTY